MGNKLTLQECIDKTINKKNELTLEPEYENSLRKNFSGSSYLSKYDFKFKLTLSKEENREKLFEILGENSNNNDIVSLDSVRYLYYALTNDNLKIKFYLIAFLIFGNKEFIEEGNYQKNLKNLFLYPNHTNYMNQFLNFSRDLIITENYIDKSKSEKGEVKQRKVIKIKDFINHKGNQNQNIGFLNNLHFLKKIPRISQFKFEPNTKNNLNFYCDCAEIKSADKYKELPKEDNLDTMRGEYDEKPFELNQVFKFEELKELLLKNNIEENLIDLIIDYLKNKTLKDYCFFDDIKTLFNNLKYDSPIEDKKRFLFNMVSTINKKQTKFTYRQIVKYLKIKEDDEDEEEFDMERNKINFEEEFDEKNFLKNRKFNEMINELKLSLENFSLIPYSVFNVKPKDKIVIQKLINNYFIKEYYENYEDYLVTNFERYSTFYAIDINFWNNLNDPKAKGPDYIDNSRIAEEINIITEEQRYRNIEIERIKKLNEEESKKNKDKNGNENINNKKNEKQKMEIIEEKMAKLKPGLKFKKDFIIVFGKLLEILRLKYKMNYIIKIKKIQEIITLNEKPKGKEENEILYNKEEEDYKKKLVKEGLNIFTIDDDKDLLSEVIRLNQDKESKEYNKIFILNELDFYPVQIYAKTFEMVVKDVEQAKERYDRLEKVKLFNEASKKEQEKMLEKEIKEKKIKEDLARLKENPKAKTNNDYKVDISMEEFKDSLALSMKEYLFDSTKGIYFRQRYKTFKEIKKRLLNDNKEILKGKKYNIYYYLPSSRNLFIPEDDFCFQNENNVYEPYVCILVDIYNKKGDCFYDLLNKKQKEKPVKDPLKLTKEQKKLLKEKEKKEKLELEKIEKEKKRKEKLEKENIKKVKKLQKKILEEEKRMINEQKLEYKRIQKKRNEELKKKLKEDELKKEKEQELQKKTESIPYIFPPYKIPNLGNTCYFNSVNQIFLNLPILQQIFLDPRINLFINKNNTFGDKGKLFGLFKSLYRIQERNIEKVVGNLKELVGTLKKDFEGTNQQDASEYLTFLIEHLHEEIDLHSSKIYIEEKDEIFNNNTLEEVGNIIWSYNLRRNASFIDSLFLFQLRSNLKCTKCKKNKYKFENNYMFNLPLSLCRLVTVEVYLHKLPFHYKLYYPEINEKFKNYVEENGNKKVSLLEQLWNYYTFTRQEEKNEQASNLHFSFDLERKNTISDVIKILRGIKILELEPEKKNLVEKSEKIELNEIKHYTDFIVYSNETKKIMFPEEELDIYVDIEDKVTIIVYETLNSLGLQELFKNYINENNNNFKLYSFISIIEKPNNFEGIKKQLNEIENNEFKQNNIKLISLKEKMVYLKNQEINSKREQINDKYKYEFILPIYHYTITSEKYNYLFRNFVHRKIKSFPVQHVILNNINNFSAKKLYDYIWNLNKLYLDHPNLDTNEFWWNKINLNKNNIPRKDNEINLKLCYPFVLRYLEIPQTNPEDENYNTTIHCPLCPWFTYCPGCIIDPRGDLSKITSKFGIAVDWCYNFVEEELSSFKLKPEIKDIDSQVISEHLPKMNKDQNIQSINDCFNLFFEEEKLEEPSYCSNCKSHEKFTKKYSINRLPYVLILSLKRFKHTINDQFKLKQMIEYHFDLKLEKKQYELYGVVNHFGSLGSGHYTAIIKNKAKGWTCCNDSIISEINKESVINQNAYILFYVSKESPYNFDYFKMMKSLMNNIVENKDKKNKFVINPDKNFFKNEPVEVDMNNKQNFGYVMEENLVDFHVDKDIDIYNGLKKENKINEEGNDKQKEENNIDNNEIKEKTKIIEIKEDNNNQIEEEEEEINEIDTSSKINERKKNRIIKKEKVPENKKDFVKVQFEFGQEWIHKSRVKKLIFIGENEKNVKKPAKKK